MLCRLPRNPKLGLVKACLNSGVVLFLRGLSSAILLYKLMCKGRAIIKEHILQFSPYHKPAKNKTTISLFPNEMFTMSRPRWLSWMRLPTGDQEVAGSTPAEVGNILSRRLIMKYFLRSFSPFRLFKKVSCQFLAKECAQYWLTA